VFYPSISVLMLQRKLAVMRDLPVDVMVANEPLSYREALAATLREVRPNVEPRFLTNLDSSSAAS
jgi:hypothetical protein